MGRWGFGFVTTITRHLALPAQGFASLADITSVQDQPMMGVHQISRWNAFEQAHFHIQGRLAWCQSSAIALIEKAGFKFVAASEVNANPKDTKDHPEGVWTLPPVYRLKDQDREKYQSIGESDRFTLLFQKPAQ